MVNEIEIQRTKKRWHEVKLEKDVIIHAAENFGYLWKDAIMEGFSPEQAFAMVREHFNCYGKAMVELSQVVSIEMMPAPTAKESK